MNLAIIFASIACTLVFSLPDLALAPEIRAFGDYLPITLYLKYDHLPKNSDHIRTEPQHQPTFRPIDSDILIMRVEGRECESWFDYHLRDLERSLSHFRLHSSLLLPDLTPRPA